jgi:hypothetical protein
VVAVDDLDVERDGARLQPGQLRERLRAVAAREQELHRHVDAGLRVAAGDDGGQLPEQEGAVQRRRRGGALRRPQHVGVGGRRARREEPPERRPQQAPVAQHRRAENGRGDRQLVGESPCVDQRGRARGPGVEDRDGHQALDPLGRAGGEQEPRPAAPVVAEIARAHHAERVEQREHVVGEPLLREVAVGGLTTPAEAAQVGRDHVEALRERRDHAAPGPPVLRPAVDEQQRRRRGIARLGDMQPDAGRQVVLGVADAGDFRSAGGHV